MFAIIIILFVSSLLALFIALFDERWSAVSSVTAILGIFLLVVCSQQKISYELITPIRVDRTANKTFCTFMDNDELKMAESADFAIRDLEDEKIVIGKKCSVALAPELSDKPTYTVMHIVEASFVAYKNNYYDKKKRLEK